MLTSKTSIYPHISKFLLNDSFLSLFFQLDQLCNNSWKRCLPGLECKASITVIDDTVLGTCQEPEGKSTTFLSTMIPTMPTMVSTDLSSKSPDTPSMTTDMSSVTPQDTSSLITDMPTKTSTQVS
ncbi:hypothetical protein NPIL_438411 [Nephila pilipes]|uniref:Uncharacterized protein n=1 Tax=Nephila pilipes TaxID=299642 RepID=A0A8X6QCT4_NEPPI|nr:hypothetical protein NPIL_438411 [Nephila pilipes]